MNAVAGMAFLVFFSALGVVLWTARRLERRIEQLNAERLLHAEFERFDALDETTPSPRGTP